MTAKADTAAAKTAADKDKEEAAAAKAAAEFNMRKLRAGTIVFLPGSSTELTLKSDVKVTGERLEKDAKFVGMLSRHLNNFTLNIDQVEGTWSPVTGRREDEPVVTEK